MSFVRGSLAVISVACGYALLALAIFTCIEIVARKLFSYSFQGVDELGGYIVAITAAFGFAYALIERAHTRIDILLMRSSARGRATLNILALLATMIFASFMAWRGLATLQETIAFNSHSSTPWETPLWIPQSIWASGLCAFAFVGWILTAHAVLLFITDPARQDREVGVPQLSEQIDEALQTQATSDAPGRPQ